MCKAAITYYINHWQFIKQLRLIQQGGVETETADSYECETLMTDVRPGGKNVYRGLTMRPTMCRVGRDSLEA